MATLSEAQVKKLQEGLNALGASPRLVADGVFGGATRRALIQFQATVGLVPDGDPSPPTLAAIAQALAQQAAGGQTARPQNGRMRVILVRGKLGDRPFGFSLGMDTLAGKLNAIPGVVATVENYGLNYSMSDDIAVALEGALRAGYTQAACIGHSMGGDTVMKVGWLMQASSLPLHLAVAVDPTPFGCPAVPANVEHAVGYYNIRPFQLGGYQIVRGQGFNGRFETHALNMQHVETDDAPVVHGRVEEIVRARLA